MHQPSSFGAMLRLAEVPIERATFPEVPTGRAHTSEVPIYRAHPGFSRRDWHPTGPEAFIVIGPVRGAVLPVHCSVPRSIVLMKQCLRHGYVRPGTRGASVDGGERSLRLKPGCARQVGTSESCARQVGTSESCARYIGTFAGRRMLRGSFRHIK